MEFGLEDSVAFVTGASRNIGAAIAANLASAGAKVAVGYERDVEAAEATCKKITDDGGVAVAFQCQLRDADSIRQTIKTIASELGPIDLLINNAGIRPHAPLGTITPDEWDSVFSVNVRAPFFASQAVIPSMVERGFGRIISLSGVDAYLGRTDRTHVIASKLAVVGLTRALATETAGTGVTANVIVPGMVDTLRGDPSKYGLDKDIEERVSIIPVQRLGTVTEVADLCLFIASKCASYITGQEIFVTGGTHPLVRR